MDVQTQILQVEVRNTRTGRTVYDVSCGDGQKRSCWEPDIAQVINSYKGTGQLVTLRVEVQQNGQYVNHTIKGFAGPGQQLPPDTNAQLAPMGVPSQSQAIPLPQGANTAPIQQASSGGGKYSPEVTARITKLASYEYASNVVGGLFAGAGPEGEAEAVAMLDRIARHVYAAARSHEQQDASVGQAGPIVPTASTPEQVAAQMPAGTVQVGVPVAAAQDAAAEAPDVIQWD